MTDTTAAPMIDLIDPATFAAGHPHEVYRWLREHDPVHWHDEPGGSGFWAVTRYRDVRAVGRDAATFSSTPTIMIPDSAGAIDMGSVTETPNGVKYRTSDGSTWRVVMEPTANGYRFRGDPEPVK